MADLTVTISESVSLNGQTRGSSNTITTSGITDSFERLVPCSHSQTTTIATFAATPHSGAGVFNLDVENTAYLRLTNLSATDAVYLAVVGTASNYTVKLRPGSSHMLFNGEDVFVAEADTSPGFTSYENLVRIDVRPAGSADCQIEAFVALT